MAFTTNKNQATPSMGLYRVHHHHQLAMSSQNTNLPRSFNLFVPVLLILCICFLANLSIAQKLSSADDECSPHNSIQCYECDSRTDPNCDDPFDFNSLLIPQQQQPTSHHQPANQTQALAEDTQADTRLDSISGPSANKTNSIKAKKLPKTANCAGCCAKIVHKSPDGSAFVKRTCSTKIIINVFLINTVCMKQTPRGDWGRLCFCDTDYCNGSQSNFANFDPRLMTVLILLALIFEIRSFRLFAN